MISRRNMLAFVLVASPVLMAGSCASLDPAVIRENIIKLCGIAVAVEYITSIINAQAGQTMQGIIDLVCSAYQTYKTALASKNLGAPASGSEVELVVHVGTKDVPIKAKVQ